MPKERINTRERLMTLLRELNGGMPFQNEDDIVREAAAFVDDASTEDEMIDAILMSSETPQPTHHPSKITVEDPDNFDQILDAIASEYEGIPTRTAGTRGDLDLGRDDDEFDEHGKNYRGEDRDVEDVDDDANAINLLDGIHDDIPYHIDATKVLGLPKTPHESLKR